MFKSIDNNNYKNKKDKDNKYKDVSKNKLNFNNYNLHLKSNNKEAEC